MRSSRILRVLLAVNLLTFLVIFPGDYFSGDRYAFLKLHGLANIAIAWVVWLAISIVAVPLYAWVRSRPSSSSDRRKYWWDAITGATWFLVFWVYVITRTPFVVYALGLFA
jgi:hypothetical protein